MIHWSKTFPEWFNSEAVTSLLLKEMTRGNLVPGEVDQAQYFYIEYMHPDLKLMPLINKARLKYGFKPYTEAEYTKKTKILFDLPDKVS